MGAWLMKRIGTPVLYWLALAGAVLIVLLGARNSGKNAERANQMRRRLNESEKVHDVKDAQLEAAARRPRTRDDLIDRMQDGSF